MANLGRSYTVPSDSQGTSAGATLPSILDLDPRSSSFTCVGRTSSNGGSRCRRRISTRDRALASSILSLGDHLLRSDGGLPQLLTLLADCVLCQTYHRGQAPTIVEEWCQKVTALENSSQNSPGSNNRASSIQSLTSAQDNLSSFANEAPSAPPSTTESRLAAWEIKDHIHTVGQPHDNTSSRPPYRNPSPRSQRRSAIPARSHLADAPSSNQSIPGASSNQSGNTERNPHRTPHQTPYYLRSSGETTAGIAPERAETRPRVVLPPAEEARPSSLADFVPAGATLATLPSPPTPSSSSSSASSPGPLSNATPDPQSPREPLPAPTSRLVGGSHVHTAHIHGVAQLRPRLWPPTAPGPSTAAQTETLYPATTYVRLTGHPPAMFPDEASTTNAPVLDRDFPRPYIPTQTLPTRKPITGDCSICYEPLDEAPPPWYEGQGPNRDLVWCRAQCGVNFHQACLGRWRENRRNISCPNWYVYYSYALREKYN
jgi:hypothetical protein